MKVLRASDKVKAYANYSTIAALFDKVIGVDESVETVVKVEAPTIRSDYGCARALYALGLAQGYDTTGTNFGLGDKMTRAQMIVQVIRFLGVEDEVKAGSYKHPFTDVPAWANNYIGYAYTNGITSGVSATKFNPSFCFLCCMARATLPKRVRSFLCAVMTATARVRSQPVCSV
ncbi:MAG: S-layer homology domain-containing protein [Clostridia bacterium]|nr:S-layer homology domain-containing protein [Clostridia bacterium]